MSFTKHTQIVPDHLDDTGQGWRELLVTLHSELVAINPGYNVHQVKEKFGGLRVYLDDYSEAINAAIRKAEETAWVTCERCGQPGSMDTQFMWVLTLCDPCKERRRKSRKDSTMSFWEVSSLEGKEGQDLDGA